MEQRSAFHNHNGCGHKGTLIVARFDDAEQIGEIHGVYSLEIALDAVRQTLMNCVRKTDLVFEVRLGVFVVFAAQASIDQGYMISERIRYSTIDMPAYSHFNVNLRMGGVTSVNPELFDKLLKRARHYAHAIHQSGLSPAAQQLLARVEQQRGLLGMAA